MANLTSDQRKRLRLGGERLFQQGSTAEIFDIHGPDRERATAAGTKAFVRQLLSPSLKLSPQERAIGNCFGAFYEQVHTGGGSEFLREHVDGGGGGVSGVSEARMQKSSMINLAIKNLKSAPMIRYSVGRGRGAKIGKHTAISPLKLIHEICVSGRTLTYIGLANGWTASRTKNGKQESRLVVPDRQRKALAEALRLALVMVGNDWYEAGYNVPYEFSLIEVE